MKIARDPASRLQNLVADGLVSEQKHPTEPLWIYNYTPVCVFKQAWNPITLQTRGLILAEDGTVVARPFEKFFNVEEHSGSDIRWKKPFQVFEKMDGSLGIMYPTWDGWKIATRGSFQSDQAIAGTEMLERVFSRKGYDHDFQINPEYTYLFEIIYPENRIVLNYGTRRELVFLCAVHIETGANVFEFGNEWDWPGTHVKRYDAQGLQIKELKDLELENQEGFVVFFPHNSTRMKTKFSEYVRLHRIITRTNTKRIWDSLRNGDSWAELLNNVPDEFFGWVSGVVGDLTLKYKSIEQSAQGKYDEIVPPGPVPMSRKSFAAKAAGHRYSSILFKMYDGEDYSEIIWKMVKPTRAEGFVTVSDEEA